MTRLGVADEDLLHLTVPGALEIPLALQKLADSGQFDALIALGAVIRGETYHFELVSNESGSGITRVALDYGIPIANAVLTTGKRRAGAGAAGGKRDGCGTRRSRDGQSDDRP